VRRRPVDARTRRRRGSAGLCPDVRWHAITRAFPRERVKRPVAVEAAGEGGAAPTGTAADTWRSWSRLISRRLRGFPPVGDVVAKVEPPEERHLDVEATPQQALSRRVLGRVRPRWRRDRFRDRGTRRCAPSPSPRVFRRAGIPPSPPRTPRGCVRPDPRSSSAECRSAHRGGFHNPVPANGPGRKDLDGEVRRTFNSPAGDDGRAARGDEHEIGLHDARIRENDVDGSEIDVPRRRSRTWP